MDQIDEDHQKRDDQKQSIQDEEISAWLRYCTRSCHNMILELGDVQLRRYEVKHAASENKSEAPVKALPEIVRYLDVQDLIRSGSGQLWST
jgi:hypothetical protein